MRCARSTGAPHIVTTQPRRSRAPARTTKSITVCRKNHEDERTIAAGVIGAGRESEVDEALLPGRGVHGNGEDWDPTGPVGFPREWE